MRKQNDRRKTSQISERSTLDYGDRRNVEGGLVCDGSIVNLFVLVQASFVVSDVGPCGTLSTAGSATAINVK